MDPGPKTEPHGLWSGVWVGFRAEVARSWVLRLRALGFRV